MTFPFRFVLAGAALFAAASPIVASAQAPRTGAAATRTAGATQPAAPASSQPHKVGLIDVGYIFSNYEKLKDRREALQKEIEASDGELKKIQEQVQAIQAQLKSVTKGSDAASKMEQQLVELNAQGQGKMQILRREFTRKEVQMYKEIYDEVAVLVQQFAEHYKYTLILRYQRDPEAEGSVDDPNRVMSRVNQLVVYHQGDDITDTILSYLNKQHQAQAGGAVAPGTPARN